MPKYQLSVEIDLPEGFGEFQEIELKILEVSRQVGYQEMDQTISLCIPDFPHQIIIGSLGDCNGEEISAFYLP